MQIQLASDLHFEHLGAVVPTTTLVDPAPAAELLVLAGDIANGCDAVRRFADWPVPVLYVLGNHESYGGVLDDVRAALRDAVRGTSIVLLDNDVVDLRAIRARTGRRLASAQPLRFIGCTLWTDYRLPGSGVAADVAMHEIALRLADHRLIRRADGEPFMPADALRQHRASRRWLARALAQPFDGRSVVVTHHAPHAGSVHPRYRGDVVNAGFASDLTPLVEQADLWLHGHVHDSFDYRVGRCRIVANPRGYALNRKTAAAPAALLFENPVYRADLTIEV